MNYNKLTAEELANVNIADLYDLDMPYTAKNSCYFRRDGFGSGIACSKGHLIKDVMALHDTCENTKYYSLILVYEPSFSSNFNYVRTFKVDENGNLPCFEDMAVAIEDSVRKFCKF